MKLRTLIYPEFAFYMNAYLHPPKEPVFNMCNKNIEHMNATEKKQCVWVIPKKYNVAVSSGHDENNFDGFFQVTVPWSDIDPEFAKNFKYKDAGVTFQFYLGSSRYQDAIDYKNDSGLREKTEEDGFLWRASIGSDGEFTEAYFKAFDNTTVHSDVDFSNIIVLQRPLYPTGTMLWNVQFYKNEKNQEQREAYIKKNIKQIDQKLMQFISQWH